MEFPGNDAMLAHNRTNSYLTTYNDGFLKALKTDLSNTNPKSIMDYQRLYVEGLKYGRTISISTSSSNICKNTGS